MRIHSLYFSAALLVGAVVFTNGCNRTKTATTQPPPPTPSQTFKSPSGKTYARIPAGPQDEDEPVVIPPLTPGAAPSGDNFHGTAREAAKLSMADSTPQEFPDIGALLDSLPSDESMRAKDISKAADSGRLPEEMMQVTITGFLCASSKESDNDYHCIVGVDPSATARFMNVEVSALPPSGSEFLAAIRAARNQFKAFFSSGENALPTSGYEKYNPPIPVKITGSVFFDVDHIPPAVGPTGMKPQSAWEIHPVREIIFEPQT
jgi:hypothetical protein